MEDLERLLGDLLESDASPGALYPVLSRLKEEGRLSLVIQQCRKALSIHPSHLGLRSLLAEACLDAGLASRASEELEQVTAGLDEMAVAYRRLAEAYERQGRRTEAVRCLGVYLAHHPSDETAREALERLQPETGEAVHEPELKAVQEAPEEDTEDLEDDDALPEIATPTLAELYFTQGQIHAAIETYEKVLADNPENTRAKERLEELRTLGEAPEEEAPSEEPPSEELVIPEAAPEEVAEEQAFEVTEEEAPPGEAEGPGYEAEPEPEAPSMEPTAGADIEEAPPEEPTEEFTEEPAFEVVEEEIPLGEAEGLAFDAEPEPEQPSVEPTVGADMEEAPPEAFAGEQALEAVEEEDLSEEPGIPETPPPEPAVDAAERKTRRMIAVLEEWLERIHRTG